MWVSLTSSPNSLKAKKGTLQMPSSSIKDVARLAGVSTATVSLVLNDKGSISPDTRQRVLDVVEQLGYKRNVRARNLRDQQSRVIGYAQSSTRTDYNPVLERFMHALVRHIEQQNRHVLLFTSQADESIAEYRELIHSQHVDGFVLSYTVTNDARFAFLHEAGVPFVAFGRSLSPLDDLVHWVDVDGRAGCFMATEHLIAQGHERIAIVTWDAASASGQERYTGYVDALQAHNIPCDPVYTLRYSNSVENGIDAAARLMSLPTPPTAIVCTSDTLAAGVLRWSAQHQTPVAVTGFDDDPIAEFMHPALTTLRQPLTLVAERIADMLNDQIEERTSQQRCELIPPELIVRASSLIQP